MPQIDIKTLQIFHRDNYPTDVGMIVSPDSPQDTITAIIDPQFTEIENKADDFFNLKPRRFTFTVRTADTSFFDAPGSFMTAHPNFPNLTNYLLRAFNGDDDQIFEGIISIDSSYSEDTQTVEVTVYDPIVLFSDSKLRYSTDTLESTSKDPFDLQINIFNALLLSYFTNSVNLPTYSTDWTIPDWGLGVYRDVYDWEDKIDQFYSDIVADEYTAATAIIGTITDVYDYSKIMVTQASRSPNLIDAKGITDIYFLGIILFVNSSNGKKLLSLYCDGYGHRATTDTTYYPTMVDGALSCNTNTIQRHYGSFVDAMPINAAKYIIKGCYFWFGLVSDGVGGTTETAQYDYDIFNPFDYTKYNEWTGTKGRVFLDPRYKSIIDNKYYPSWNIITADIMKTYITMISNNMLMLEDGSLIEGEYEYWTSGNTFKEDAFVYVEYNGLTYRIKDDGWTGVTNTIGTFYDPQPTRINILDYPYNTDSYTTQEESNFESGIVLSNDNTSYEYKINYESAYPLSSSDFGTATLHKNGNISKDIGFLPSSIVFKPEAETTTDYLFDTQSDDLTYYNVAELLQFFLASMNLYCYYTGKTFTFVRSFLSSVGTPIVIDTSDIIDWNTQTQEYAEIDTESVLKPTLNYVPNALDTYYNEYAAMDNKKATCKISRLFADPDYSIEINSVLSISSLNWRVERINTYIGYYDVVLTKYITDPV